MESDSEFLDRMSFTVPDDGMKERDFDRLFTLARRGAAVQWRPIEEAPKDGTTFQAWIVHDGRGWWEPKCVFDDNDALNIWTRIDYDMDGWESGYTATHWMPFPPPPAGEQR